MVRTRDRATPYRRALGSTQSRRNSPTRPLAASSVRERKAGEGGREAAGGTFDAGRGATPAHAMITCVPSSL